LFYTHYKSLQMNISSLAFMVFSQLKIQYNFLLLFKNVFFFIGIELQQMLVVNIVGQTKNFDTS